MSGFYEPRSHRTLFGLSLGWVLAIVVVVVALSVAGLFARSAFAPTRGKLEARIQINSAANRIAAYDHFFNLCAAVQGQEGALVAQRAELAATAGADRKRVLANIAGIEAQRSRSVAQYNADARKSYTIGQFKASDLPFELSPTTPAGGTSCVA